MIPQSVEPQDAAPHPAPRILVDRIPSNLLTPILSLIRQGSADAAKSPPCHCVLVFDGISVEADPDLTLEARWFVDYDSNVPSSTVIQVTLEIPPNRDNPRLTNRTVLPYTLDADAVGIVQSGVHVVEIVIGETDGFDKSTAAPRRNRSMKPGYASSEYRFAVNVRVEQVPGQCPLTPPSEPKCQ